MNVCITGSPRINGMVCSVLIVSGFVCIRACMTVAANSKQEELAGCGEWSDVRKWGVVGIGTNDLAVNGSVQKLACSAFVTLSPAKKLAPLWNYCKLVMGILIYGATLSTRSIICRRSVVKERCNRKF